MIVTPVSPSSSVTTAVRVLSSALVPVMDAEPISLMFVTVTVNDCVVVCPLITLPLPSKLLDNTSDQKTALTEAKMEDDYLKEKASKIGEFENAEMVSVHPAATACMDRLFR